MKGEVLLKALEFLKDEVINQADFFVAFLNAGYGAGLGGIDYEYQKRRKISDAKKSKAQILKERKRRLAVFVSKMKHDGLIQILEGNILKISENGKRRIAHLKNGLPARHYEVSLQRNPIIVSFDIPERLRRKRNWLREVLRNLGFKMIHQSVWMGKTKIPKVFITDLELLKILEFVQIFEVSKEGSLEKLV